jgi:hypothetical protein
MPTCNNPWMEGGDLQIRAVDWDTRLTRRERETSLLLLICCHCDIVYLAVSNGKTPPNLSARAEEKKHRAKMELTAGKKRECLLASKYFANNLTLAKRSTRSGLAQDKDPQYYMVYPLLSDPPIETTERPAATN